ncbi:MAG: EAL domain-containing protein [Lachnospiraceae bacterium]|nr:EAL domain-containing protein [Lachnospiraceae bacterium]
MSDEQDKLVLDALVRDYNQYLELFSDMSDAYDMGGLVTKMKKSFVQLCENCHVKRLQCDIITPQDNLLTTEINTQFVIYETEGPEYDNIMRQYTTPAGEVIQCSICFTTYLPTDLQLLQAKCICELVHLYIGRAKIGASLTDALNMDVVTGMPNTKAFFNFGDKLFWDSTIADYCVIALNICNFKYVNQTVPFNVGTSVLVRYAHKLMSFLKADEFVTRAGGDNFHLLVKKENLNSFIENVSMIPIEIKSGNMRVHFELTCYMGVCVIETRMSVQSAVENAINTMTIAKHTPHTPVMYYTEEIGEKQHYINEILAKFVNAIDNREFIAYYQPKVNLVTQKIIGMEALVRWKTGDKIVSPGQFIGILENSRYIMDLDQYMLRQVCRDIKRWESMELEIPRISINLSRRNLQNEEIADEIAAILDEYHVDYSNVEIEVTETMDSEEFKFLERFIARMKHHGIKVSIDDFGTGYSSLNLLKMLNADVLKIDRSFINLESFTEKDELMVKSIVKLANAYDMEVITEGVETEEQINFMLKVGCQNVQGFFFDKPLSKEIVTERLRIGRYDKKFAV